MDIPAELYPALARYMNKAHEHSNLSRAEVLELCGRCRGGNDKQARRYLVRAHMRYAIAIALKYHQYGLPLSVLITEGEFGIVHALTKFDSDRARRFLTYVAYWIRACILNFVIQSLSSVEVDKGTSRSKLLFKLRREKVRIANLLGEGNDTAGLLAERFNGRDAHGFTAASADLSRLASHAAP